MQTRRWKLTRLPIDYSTLDGYFVQLGTYGIFTDKLEWSIVGFVHKESGRWYAGHDENKVRPHKLRRDAAEAEIKDYIGI